MTGDRDDYYHLLGISSQASEKEIKVAYKKLALKLHPDVRKNEDKEAEKAATEDFRKVAEAYEVLKDKHQRALYDYSRSRAKASPNTSQNHSSSSREEDWDDFLRSQAHKYSGRHHKWQQQQSKWKSEAEQRERERAAKEAWEEEKKEAKRRKVRTRERLLRTEEAHRVRVGVKLKEFWQTSPNLHRNDVVFLSVMSGCMVSLVLFSWM